MRCFIHNQNKEFRVPLSRRMVLFRAELVFEEEDKFENVEIYYWNRQLEKPDEYKKVNMKIIARVKSKYYLEGIIETDFPSSYIKYLFRISYNGEHYFHDYYGFNEAFNPKYVYEYLYTNPNEVLYPSTWLSKSVFYQIFPERFRNGNYENDPLGCDEWGSVPTRTNYMGGDIQGIIEKLDYIQELGINAIYLNPIFDGSSNHKYDTTDYFKIDLSFGNEETLRELVTECHKKGIRIILDGVFNHCGIEFPYFAEARDNIHSPYRQWFYFDSLNYNTTTKLDYECVGYYKYMPKFNFSSKEVRNYFISVGRYWIKEYDIDGWRLDVADEIDYTFWYEFKTAIKEEKEDVILLAETWSEKKDMIFHNQMDSLMNYLFRDAVVEFIAEELITATEFERRLSNIIGNYSSVMINQLYNLLGSHDTERFLTITKGNVKKHQLALVTLLMFKGVPGVYYGDEIPLEGENDPGCRNAMEWEENSQTVKEYLRKLINIRKRNPVIIEGDYKPILCQDKKKCFGFAIKSNCESIYIVINNSDEQQKVKLPVFISGGTLLELIEGKEEIKVCSLNHHEAYYHSDINEYKGEVSISLLPYSAKIFKN